MRILIKSKKENSFIEWNLNDNNIKIKDHAINNYGRLTKNGEQQSKGWVRKNSKKTQENCQTLLEEPQRGNAVTIKDSNSYKKTENSHFLRFLIT